MPAGTLLDLYDGVLAEDRPDLLRWREEGGWRSLPTGEFARRVRGLTCALADLGVGAGDRVALLAGNRPEWAIADFAILNAGATTVPLYPTLSPRQAAAIVADSGARAAIVSTSGRLEELRAAGGAAAGLTAIVLEEGSAALSLERAIELGAEADRRDPAAFDRRREAVSAGSLASLIYTSGTTGEPKGVMLTHGNLASNVEAVRRLVPMRPDDVALSFLPLSHVFERTVDYCYFRNGVTIAYAESVETVARDLLEVRPTLAAAVPRVFEKVQARVLEAVREGPGLRRALFRWAMERGRRRMAFALEGRRPPPGLALSCAIADRLVFARLKGRLGGRVRYFISGGAPLPRQTAEFFLSAGIMILEGYGLTETSPVIAVNSPERLRPGTVGQVAPGVEVRIADDGEILVRGPNVMKGYWNRPEETARVLRDGWFHTGDIGRFDEDGFLAITDRKKDLLVTSGGKNVAPQPLENAMKSSRFIANAVCVGDGRNYIAALIVPDFEALGAWAAGRGIGETGEALARRPEVEELIRGEVNRTMEEFSQYERVKRFALLDRDFTLEAGELTPTMKVKRRVIAEKHARAIEGLYR